MSKRVFYILSFTWGLPMTLVGCLVAMVLLILGHKPKKWGYCYYFEVGEGWGGLELGMFFLCNKNPTEHIKNHETGHSLQNCVLGPLMPFAVCIPSAIRYWYRAIRQKIGKPCKTKYDDFWVEGSATRIGTEFMKRYNTK